ncbi:hypothetical protein [Endozoicomonas sp. 8E]|uniref:hypothetical protein n=1 Tax=Endozoicomonas sp. 8E TaxID=3035692 RepID=UPI0029391536|nr:hypothetical protein [Endozoicomonas sp. 8E]WOG28297.1 hypothetical protein P6910_01205 [Endozoicomonas sp. 8E]
MQHQAHFKQKMADMRAEFDACPKELKAESDARYYEVKMDNIFWQAGITLS